MSNINLDFLWKSLIRPYRSRYDDIDLGIYYLSN
jgi:hypothetical protein